MRYIRTPIIILLLLYRWLWCVYMQGCKGIPSIYIIRCSWEHNIIVYCWWKQLSAHWLNSKSSSSLVGCSIWNISLIFTVVNKLSSLRLEMVVINQQYCQCNDSLQTLFTKVLFDTHFEDLWHQSTTPVSPWPLAYLCVDNHPLATTHSVDKEKYRDNFVQCSYVCSYIMLSFANKGYIFLTFTLAESFKDYVCLDTCCVQSHVCLDTCCVQSQITM
jgi:hypothetical protein